MWILEERTESRTTPKFLAKLTVRTEIGKTGRSGREGDVLLNLKKFNIVSYVSKIPDTKRLSNCDNFLVRSLPKRKWYRTTLVKECARRYLKWQLSESP